MRRANLTALSQDMKAERLLLLIQIIQDEAELYQFCNEKLTLGSDEHKKMLNHLFYFFCISQEMMQNRVDHPFPSFGIYRHISGTRKVHQMMNRNGDKRNFSCLCKFCYSNEYENCIYLDDTKFFNNKDQVRLIWHTFNRKGERSAKAREDITIKIALVVKILSVKVKKRLNIRKQHHALLNVMMLQQQVQGMDFHISC